MKHSERKIKEMATLLGLTPETVVQALINDSSIDERIKSMVLKMAKEMHIQTSDIDRDIIEANYFIIKERKK